MDDRRLPRLLDEIGLAHSALHRIPGGWASDTFAVTDTTGDRWIVRVARTAEVAAAHRREARLLPALAERMPFAVPVPEHVGDWHDRTYMTYREIPGRELRAGDDPGVAVPALQALHRFPADSARRLLGCDGTPAEWRRHYVDLWPSIERSAFPHLDAELRRSVEVAYVEFLDGSFDFTPVLVHRDLGTEHVLVDADGALTGVIDFEDATVGDPAIDFVGIWLTFGPDAVRRLVAAYGADERQVSMGRMAFYRWMGSLHAVVHGVETGDHALVADAVDELRKRLGQPPQTW